MKKERKNPESYWAISSKKESTFIKDKELHNLND